MDAEHRRLAVALDRDFRFSEPQRDILDELAHRPLDRGLVSVAVGLEPFPALMEGERFEERQRLRTEALETHCVTLYRDGAIQRHRPAALALDCFASLAMTESVKPGPRAPGRRSPSRGARRCARPALRSPSRSG